MRPPTGPGAALWVEAETQDEAPADERVPELAREYKSLATMILQQRGAWQIVDSVQSITDPSVLADLAGCAPYVTNEQKLWLSETVDVAARLEKLVAWSREHLAELDVAETIRKDVQEGMDKAAARIPPAPATGGHLQGAVRAERQVRLRGAGLPRAGRGRGPAGEGG